MLHDKIAVFFFFIWCKRTTAVSLLLAVNLYFVYLYMFEYKSVYCIIAMDIYKVYSEKATCV